MKTLLERVREINRLIQNTAGHPLDIAKMIDLMSESFNSNVYAISKKNILLGCALMDGFDCPFMKDELELESKVGKKYPGDGNQVMLKYEEPVTNIYKEYCVFRGEDTPCYMVNKYSNVIPILGGGQRLGTLLFAGSQPSSEDDLVLAEYIAALIGMAILRAEIIADEKIARKKAVVEIAFDTLSYSELEALVYVFRELNNQDGLLVASKIADKVGITRSVIVNALRKLESAGLVEVRSLGMKGTYIHIMNEFFVDTLDNFKIMDKF